MRLSFVIPTRNQASFLRQCIDSCLAQNIGDSEILVLDGASTDNTVEVLRSYGERITWWSKRDRGQADAVNQGVNLAKGDVIAWINSDDYYAASDVVAALLAEIDRGVEVAYGDGERVDENGAALGRYDAQPIGTVEDIVTWPASFVLQPAVLFRRDAFLRIGGLDESLHYALDYDLWIRMFQSVSGWKHVPRVIAQARYHADAKSIALMTKQIREAHRVKRRAMRSLNLSLSRRLLVHAGVATMWVYWLAVKSGLKRAV
jgi:glycosyltransferase involved in cell wall biosynthesis